MGHLLQDTDVIGIVHFATAGLLKLALQGRLNSVDIFLAQLSMCFPEGILSRHSTLTVTLCLVPQCWTLTASSIMNHLGALSAVNAQ